MMATSALSALLLLVPPETVTVQGTLASAGGTPVDGKYTLTAALYGAPTGGQPYWSHPFTDVPVVQGVFSLSLQAVEADFFDDPGGVWLGIKIEGDTELTRTEIVSVPMALVSARSLDVSCSACIGVGELSPALLDSINAGIPPGYTDAEAVAAVLASGKFLLTSTGILPSALPPGGLDEISNGLVTNQFSDVVSSTAAPIPIPDGFVDGVSDSITVPDLGLVEALTVSVAVANSNVKNITISLLAPNGEEYVLYAKTSSGASFQSSFPDPTAPKSGDLGTWVGKNPAGTWKLTVIDDVKNLPATQPFDGQITAWSIALQTLSSKKVAVTGDLVVAGAITGVGAVPPGAVMSFNRTSCPPGWTELTAARGRVVVGLGNAGTLLGLVGTPLADLTPRRTSEVPSHSHTIDPPATTSTNAGSHSHCLNVSGADDNNHTGNFDGVADSDAGAKGCIRNTSSAGEHTHTTDVGQFDSGATGVGTVDVGMPYIQLLTCEKL